jgi:nucleotide-binding universal stress UspA family protein
VSSAATMQCMAARPKRVLVGYDGSDSAQRALDVAAGLIGYGSTLAVASIASPGSESGHAPLDDAREHLLERQVQALYVLRHGDAADQLVDAAQVLGADLIVVGGRTHNGHASGLGRVSRDVLEHAPCDVLVVR